MRLYKPMLHCAKNAVRPMLKSAISLAWRLGIKLPRSYDFFYLSSHGVGHNAMLGFLHHCGARLNWHFEESGKQRYVDIYQRLLKDPLGRGRNAICLSECGFDDREKFFHSFSKRVPAIFLVRDPIGVIKSILNLTGRGGRASFTLQTPYEEIMQVGFGNFMGEHITWRESIPHLASIEMIAKDTKRHVFIQNSLYESLSHAISQIRYIDMQEITSDHAYTTMLSLSQALGLNPPDESSVIWRTKMYGELNGILPFTLQIPCDNTMLRVSITLEQYAMWERDIAYILQDFIATTQFTNIAITIPSHQQHLLKKHPDILKHLEGFCRGFIAALENQVASIIERKVTEEHVLGFLRTHTDIAALLHSRLHKELQHIRTERPDILESWSYYKEFLEICKDI